MASSLLPSMASSDDRLVPVELRQKRAREFDESDYENDDEDDDRAGYGAHKRFARPNEHVLIIKECHHSADDENYDDDEEEEEEDCLSSYGDEDDDEHEQEQSFELQEQRFAEEQSFELQEQSFPLQLRASFSDLFDREILYMPRSDFYLKLQSSDVINPSSRQRAIFWLLKMQDFFKFSVHTAALAINYLDRFLSQSSSLNGKAWMMQLLSVACLSLAAKMEEIEVPLLQDLQVDAEFIFEPSTIQRMELLVLSTLGWRMGSVTAFSYTDFFMSGFDLPLRTKKVLISRINQLILAAIQDLRFLAHRPSSIAGAAMLCAYEEILPLQFKDQKPTLLCLVPLHLQEELMDCHGLMMDLYFVKIVAIKDGMSECSVPRSPMGVLDASFSSNSINSFISSQRNQCISSTPPKRRRMDSNI